MTEQAGTLRGKITAGATIRGKLAAPRYVGGVPYTGDYVVTPKITQQVLPTAQKTMTDDVTVRQIPRYDVSNAAGGVTINIGRTLDE